jgi:Zn-dependent protease
MFDLSLQMLLFRVVALLLIATAQGAALAGAAALLGDQGPRHDGRMTPSPAPHLDVVGGIAFVVFRLGWTKPVALDAAALRFGRLGVALVALAGLAACLALGVILELFQRPALMLLAGNLGLSLAAFLEVAAGLCVSFALFNALPLPPLTGGHFLQALYPPAGALFNRYRAVCVILLAALIATGLAERMLSPIFAALGAR